MRLFDNARAPELTLQKQVLYVNAAHPSFSRLHERHFASIRTKQVQTL